MRKLKKILIALTAMALIAGSYGWYMYNKKPADTRQLTALATINAVDLVKKYQQDEAAANKLYVDKLIIVSGRVSNAQIDADGHATVMLDTGDPLAAVTCSFYNEEAQAVKNKLTGSTVRVKGICTGILTDVILNKCSLVQ
jgi:hypothetical protein